MRHFMTGGYVFISFTESFQEKASERGVSGEHERAVHVVVIRDLVNDIIGPEASGSSSHVREGKNNLFLLSGKFGIARFKVKLQLSKEGFCLFDFSSVIVWNLCFEFVVFVDRSPWMRSSGIVIRWNWHTEA